MSNGFEVVNVTNVNAEEVENIAGKNVVVHPEEVVRCQNSFEVLSKEEMVVEVDCEKDCCSDPGCGLVNSVSMDAKDVAVRKSRRKKVQPNKLTL